MVNLKIKIVRTPLGYEELVIKDGAVGRLAEMLAIEDRLMYALDPLGNFDPNQVWEEWHEDPRDRTKGFLWVVYATRSGALVPSVN
jgi:pullulanase/glycogen debranching enzyme